MNLTTTAVVFAQPGQLSLERLELTPPGAEDVVVDIDWSGISTGTERLLWTGRMPSFPGHGLSPGPGLRIGRAGRGGRKPSPGWRWVRRSSSLVPIATVPVRGLFGGASARIVVPGARVVSIAEQIAEQGVLLALAATAYHAVSAPRRSHPSSSSGMASWVG